ncbi:SURF1 family protein [Novosphingobium sp.]|uniref:SURF1 family protein n=1 Tax=Novosphingobium sp. TaxID=1874826 RepID=UPI00333E225F
MTTVAPAALPARRGAGAALAMLMLALVFAALGVWQVQRMGWKSRLIAATQTAVHAPPISVAVLPRGDLAALAYRPVVLRGHYTPATATLVTGTSVLGTGYWELVPLVDDGGQVVFVNRGFLPQGSRIERARAAVPTGRVETTGLLRLTEPGGTWLRANTPRDNRWYSRDIAMIARTRGVTADPRLFIDAAAESPVPVLTPPTMGLTVLDFPNSHLGYALTWFALAVMAVAGAVMLYRRG